MKKLNPLTIFILFFALISVQSVVAQRYSIEETSTHNLGDDGSYTITPEYPSDQLYFETYLSDNVTQTHSVTVLGEKYELNTDNPKKWGITQAGNDPTSDDPLKKTISISPASTNSITFQASRYWSANKTIYVRNIKVRMANHILLNTPANGSTNDLGEVEIGKSATLNVKFKSFLVNNNLTVKSNNSFFTINGNTSHTITTTADPFCSTSENKFDFKITYQPTSAGNHSATITISDGTNSQTFTITGTCVKKTNTINWNGINTQIPVGESISLGNVTSTSKANITFTSNAPEIIKVENNNKLIALAEGKATITATTDETNEYTSAVSTLEFKATQKTIQTIVWNQDFYLLKLGDADTTLNAYAIDKKTGVANGNTIEYSVENSNVVTITNGRLHIVGKGQTTITAHQQGNETYAEAYMTKVVMVREVSDACDAPILTELSTPASKNGAFNWDAITHTTAEWTTVPDKLTFTISCSSAATKKLGDTSGAELEIKDQNGNYVYGPKQGNNQSKTHTIQLDRSVRKLSFSLTCNLDRSISNIIVTPAIYVEKDRESITFTDTEIGISTFETVNIDWANQPDGLWATIENDNHNVFSITRNEYFGGSCGDYDKTPVEVEFYSEIEGDYSADLVIYMGYENPVEKYRIPLTAKALYRETTFNNNGNWNDNANWSTGIPTGIGKNATIAAAVTIPNGYTAVANNITIADGGSIIIEPQGTLKVNNIIGSNSTNITLQADENGSAILLFKNDDSNKVKATVQLYTIASSDGLRNGQAGNFKDPKWQYFGITADEVAFSTLNQDGTTNWIYRWDETQNATSCWAEELSNGSTLTAWTGYCLAQESAITYNYSGTLLNNNHTYSLTYTPENASDDLGNNLITNSYNAPIDITTLSDANFTNAEANLYIYNTGSYLEWKNNSQLEGFNPGQVIVIPVNTINELGNEYPRTIASGQAFFVKTTNKEASFAVDYEGNVYGSARKDNQMRAPKTNKEFNTLKIQITGSTSNDRLYLLEHDNTTANFDNGYDAVKIFDNPNGPQIYASTPFGYSSINTDASFDGQAIGFIANDENEIYTISFDITNLVSYSELYLYDTETEIYIDILNEESYQFYGSKTPNNSRFIITSTRNDAPQSGDVTTEVENFTSLDDIFIENKPIYLYTITGQLIDIYNTLQQLPTQEGIYIIKSGDKTLKLIIKK